MRAGETLKAIQRLRNEYSEEKVYIDRYDQVKLVRYRLGVDGDLPVLIILLKEREKDILMWRYGNYGRWKTLQELSDEMGISVSRVRLLETRSLMKIRAYYADDILREYK